MAGIFDMIGSFFHPERPYEKAEEAARQSWNQSQGFQQPYNQQGLEQYGRLNQAAGSLLNPAELQNQWSSGYENSPYAKQLLGMNQSQGLDAASQMGLLGSSAALGNIQQGAGNIVAQYRQKYLDDLMQKYMQGIGLGKDIYGIGSQAAANLGAQALSHGQDISGLRYGQSAAPGSLFGKILGTGLNFIKPGIGSAFTGQFMQPGNMYGCLLYTSDAADE